MTSGFEKFTLEEAWVCIKINFSESKGIIAQIEKGMEIDEINIQMIEVALQRISLAWEDMKLVPKKEVQLLWNVLPRLEKCLLLYPYRKVEIGNLIARLSERLDALFSSSKMSEEHAIALVCQHLVGVPSFMIELRLGEINETSLEELLLALDTLAQEWKGKENISKLAVGGIISTQNFFSSVSGLYSTSEKQHLQAIELRLCERISRCLT